MRRCFRVEGLPKSRTSTPGVARAFSRPENRGGASVTAGDRLRLAALRALHENRELERLFRETAAAGLAIDDWSTVQEETVTGEKKTTRYGWIVEGRGNAKAAETADGDEGEGESKAEARPEPKSEMVECPNIPSILKQLHEVGRRGIEVKRFKGLGEMDAEQLWETTMNPANRTLLRVTWDSASEADQLFTILMGENVEERRASIEKHAVEVKSLDV
jgi:DNA gyrase subunit B